ncbi:MAG: hypothetical protein ACREJO_13400 [Phycisphaerales bacterium]
MPRYVVRHNEKQEFCVELRSPEGALLLDCMSFTTHASALVGITNVRVLAPFESRYLRIAPPAAALPCSFLMQDYKQRTVANGADHPTVEAREGAILACQTYGPVARVVDETGGPGLPPLEYLQ